MCWSVHSISRTGSQRLHREKQALKVVKIGMVDITGKSVQQFIRTLTADIFLSNKYTCTG